MSEIGRDVTLTGPVMSVRFEPDSDGRPTFINIGRDYPDPGRLVALVWGQDLGDFIDQPLSQYTYGEAVCVQGLVSSYQGVPEIVLTSPTQISPLGGSG